MNSLISHIALFRRLPLAAFAALFVMLVTPGAWAATASIAAGDAHSVALKNDGTVWTWGQNNAGQLGDATTTDKSSPVQVGSGFTAIAAGASHTLALKSDGSVWAWGLNASGQLGDASGVDKSSPVQVGTGYVAIACGGYHSLAIKSDGSLWAWGQNTFGQLGDGTTTDRSSPVKIGTGYYSVTAGAYHTLATTIDGILWSWGYNDSGQLGDGTIIAKGTPTGVGMGINAMAAGAYHSAVISAGGIYAWGWNVYGQLGDGTTTDQTIPAQTGGTDFSTITAGANHTLAIKTDATLWAWGSNDFGQIGDSTTTQPSGPTQIGTAYAQVVAGGFHSVAMKTDGSLWAWGSNDYGQLGDGSLTQRSSPTQIMSSGFANSLSLSAGWSLIGNSSGAAINVASYFADTAKVTTVWKWNSGTGRWAFYAPSLTAQGLIDYAAGKGMDVLSSINAGDGFWVNGKTDFSVALPGGNAVPTVAMKTQLVTGWNLVSISETTTPSLFNSNLSSTIPAAGEVPINLTTLWAWDSGASDWAFYAPSLEKSGGLSSYIDSKGYRDFTSAGIPLASGRGFWVNKP